MTDTNERELLIKGIQALLELVDPEVLGDVLIAEMVGGDGLEAIVNIRELLKFDREDLAPALQTILSR